MPKRTKPKGTDIAWQRYIDHQGITFDEPSYFVDAKELKAIARGEPRLLAKFDTSDELPLPFSKSGYTLVPIRNGRYLIVRGNMFVTLHPCNTVRTFHPTLPFPLLTTGRGEGEAQYIDFANHTGLLADFLNINQMYLTIRGRERTQAFEYVLAGQAIDVRGVQIEVDAGYESRNDIVLVEAKIGMPRDFNIRQLYYPYRHFYSLVPQKRVRNIFLAYEARTGAYHFYEYIFPEIQDPLSARVIACCTYNLTSLPHLKIDSLHDVRFQSKNNIVPQADDLNKIIELLQLLLGGINTSEEISQYFAFDRRQSSYYIEAARYLGLVVVTDENGLDITEQGRYVISQQPDKQPEALARAVVNSWIFVELIEHARHRGSFTEADVAHIVSAVQDRNGHLRYTSTTIGRRTQTIRRWLRWLTEYIGCFMQEGDKYKLN